MRKSAPILLTAFALVVTAAPATPSERAFVIAQQTPAGDDAKDDDSLQAKFNGRFPQEVKVGHLIGMPVLNDSDVTLGHVQKVARTPKGKIELIVSYSKWFGWFGRPVAVPIEVVGIEGRQVASLDMPRSEYAAAPTWQGRDATTLPDDATIRIALGRN